MHDTVTYWVTGMSSEAYAVRSFTRRRVTGLMARIRPFTRSRTAASISGSLTERES